MQEIGCKLNQRKAQTTEIIFSFKSTNPESTAAADRNPYYICLNQESCLHYQRKQMNQAAEYRLEMDTKTIDSKTILLPGSGPNYLSLISQ